MPPIKSSRPLAKLSAKFQPESKVEPSSDSHVSETTQKSTESKVEAKTETAVTPSPTVFVENSSPAPSNPKSALAPAVAAAVVHEEPVVFHKVETTLDYEDVDNQDWVEEEPQPVDVDADEKQQWAENNENIYENADETAETTDTYSNGLVAVALYDYQASAEDELSFDPDEVIYNIEMVLKAFNYYE